MTHSRRQRLQRWGAGAIALLSVMAGLFFLLLPTGDQLTQASFDLSFRFRSAVTLTNLVIVSIDRNSVDRLQRSGWPLNRSHYVKLLERLTEEGARLVVFDVFFRTSQPEIDAAFAQALRAHGHVILGGIFEVERYQSTGHPDYVQGQIKPPTPQLREAAAGWGLLTLRDVTSDSRKILTQLNGQESAVWAAARLLGAPVTAEPEPHSKARWFNFYGPAHSFDEVSLFKALEADGVPPGYFRDKIVFIGAHPSLSAVSRELDVFATPFSRFHRDQERHLMPGVEMLATAYANLARGEWLTRISDRTQILVIVGWGVFFGIGFTWLRPWPGIGVAVLAVGLLGASAAVLLVAGRLWWSWLVPAVIQTPVAFVAATIYRYFVIAREQRQLRSAFVTYLSPHLVDRIAESDLELTLGGKEVEATVLFTDLEGFSTISESLRPQEVSELLTSYFEQVTRSILSEEGTIIKYIGDAVMAVWGAPLPDPRQAERAVRAACGMVEASRAPIAGRILRTRIGINTGLALAGNLGSRFRFDYTVIGATTNLASRLESLNKHFGTNILISEATRQTLSDDFTVRFLGQVLVRGFAHPARVYEVLGMATQIGPNSSWRRNFSQGMEQMAKRDYGAAASLFHQVVEERAEPDGPAAFYLLEIHRLQSSADGGRSWDGVIRLGEV